MARKTTKVRKYRGPSRPVDPRYAQRRTSSKGPDTFGLGLVAIGVVVVILIVLVAALFNGGAAPASTTTTTTGNVQDPAQATSAAATAVEQSFATQIVGLPTISPAEAISLQAANNATIFDVRGADQYNAKHIAGAKNILYTDAPKRVAEIPKTGNVILYCQ